MEDTLNGLKAFLFWCEDNLGKNILILSRFGIVYFHCKWNGTRLLSPGNECTISLKSCQAT